MLGGAAGQPYYKRFPRRGQPTAAAAGPPGREKPHEKPAARPLIGANRPLSSHPVSARRQPRTLFLKRYLQIEITSGSARRTLASLWVNGRLLPSGEPTDGGCCNL